MMPSMAENWANTPAKAAIPPTPPARRQSSYGQSKNTRNHLEGIYADIANKVTDPFHFPFSFSLYCLLPLSLLLLPLLSPSPLPSPSPSTVSFPSSAPSTHLFFFFSSSLLLFFSSTLLLPYITYPRLLYQRSVRYPFVYSI